MQSQFHWLEDLRYARSPRDLERCARYFAGEHGLPYFAFTALLCTDNAEEERLSFHNFTGAWARRYGQIGRTADDPRIEAALREIPAVSWCSDGRLHGLIADAPAATAQFLAEVGEHGLRSGVAVPWRGRGVRWAFLSFSQDRPCDPFALIEQTVLAQYFCGHLVDAMLRLRGRPGHPSGHAMQALAWYAAGESMSEIAKRLNLSYHTVRTYLNRACTRLGARNLPQAVALAVRRGLIP